MVLGQAASLIWGFIEQAYCQSRATAYDVSTFKDQTFRMSWRSYTWPLFGLLAALLFWSSATRFHDFRASFLFGIIGLIFAAFGLLGIYSCLTTVISIREGKVYYCERHELCWMLRLSDITNTTVIPNRFTFARIRIQTEMGKNYGLDMGFQQVTLLLAMLQRYRPVEFSSANKKYALELLAEDLTTLVTILRRDPNCQWRTHFESCVDKAHGLLLENVKQNALNDFSMFVTSVYGGMGSFSDYGPVIFDSKNGKAKAIAGTEEFDTTCKRIFKEAKALRNS